MFINISSVVKPARAHRFDLHTGRAALPRPFTPPQWITPSVQINNKLAVAYFATTTLFSASSQSAGARRRRTKRSDHIRYN
ncbi:hypothetical protein EVAR_8001_1 [Eumeta japonica]|uniref:Uncharacterized protein n=1 Tax=Eumeta variegata TaxID=151549 RepID=A0A4C1THU9_EUMVA|nr:hypothetical protein EVAR_8001_1 [Eumeta japonica]